MSANTRISKDLKKAWNKFNKKISGIKSAKKAILLDFVKKKEQKQILNVRKKILES